MDMQLLLLVACISWHQVQSFPFREFVPLESSDCDHKAFTACWFSSAFSPSSQCAWVACAQKTGCGSSAFQYGCPSESACPTGCDDLKSYPEPQILTGQWTDQRLPQYVRPSHYDLKLRIPKLNKKVWDDREIPYTGEVKINLQTHAPTNAIVLHTEANYSKIHDASIKVTSGPQSVTPEKTYYNHKTQMLTLIFKDTLPNFSPLQLYASFEGHVETPPKQWTPKWRNQGFYGAVWNDTKNMSHVFSLTQFESVSAREVFPSFDEPNLKATYELSLTFPKDYNAESNMPASSNEVDGELRTKVFPPTPHPMSTYLMAWSINKFDKVERITTDFKTPIKVWTYRPLPEMEYAGDTVVKVVDFFGEYFDFPYHQMMPKLDLLAVPDEYYDAGAMENWGLITFADYYILVSNTTTPMARVYVAVVIAHECAHMWTGNTVTTAWWSHLWLNEGFAEWLENLGGNASHPEWWRNTTEYIIQRDQYKALSRDRPNQKYYHPIINHAVTQKRIEGIFDSITYAKGASVIRLLAGWLDDVYGANTWRDALRYYLKQNQWKNAYTDALWDAVVHVTKDESVRELCNGWVTSTGYPIVYITMSSDGTTLTLEQHKYNFTKNSVDDYLYPIVPVRLLLPGGNIINAYMKNQRTVTVKLPQAVKWFKCDPGQNSYYICQYPTAVWNELIQAINSTTLNPNLQSSYDKVAMTGPDAIGLYHQSVLLHDIGLLNGLTFVNETGSKNNLTVALLQILDVITNNTKLALRNKKRGGGSLLSEVHHQMWSSLLEEADSTHALLSSSPQCEQSYQNFRKLYLPKLHRLTEVIGFSDSLPQQEGEVQQENGNGEEALSAQMLREQLVATTSKLVDVNSATDKQSHFVRTALNLFDNHFYDMNNQVREGVYITALRFGGTQRYNEGLSRYQHSTDPVDKRRLLKAMCMIPDQTLLKRTLDYLVQGTITDGVSSAFEWISENSDANGAHLVWEFLETHWQKVTLRIPSSQKLLTIVTSCATHLHGADASKVVPFLRTHGWGIHDIEFVQKAMREQSEEARIHHARHT